MALCVGTTWFVCVCVLINKCVCECVCVSMVNFDFNVWIVIKKIVVINGDWPGGIIRRLDTKNQWQNVVVSARLDV